MKVTIRTYQIGLATIGAFALVLLIIVVASANGTRQDAATDKAAQSIVDKLNNYTSDKGEIPESLSKTGATDVPPTIKYTKVSDSEFKFCVTYKAASSGYDASSAITDIATGSLGRSYNDYYQDPNMPETYLYISTTHKKGENCHTVRPYLYNKSMYDPFEHNSFGTKPTTSTGLGTIQSTARDTERQTDIRALQSQLEAYYAQAGKYPLLSDVNSATWRAQNMKGLDSEALKDPNGTSAMLVSTPTNNAYSYEVTGAGGKACDNVKVDCASYVLTAKMEAGSDETLYSLN